MAQRTYDALHPETVAAQAGGTFHGNQHTGGRGQDGQGLPPRFTKATADATGISERSVRRMVERRDRTTGGTGVRT